MFQINKLLAKRQPYFVPGVGCQWWRIGAIADRLRTGIPWWMGLLLFACLFVLPNLLSAKLAKLWLQVPGLDKPTHFLVFIVVFLIVYSVLLSRPWPESQGGKLKFAVGLSLGISVADEIQQALLGIGRTAEYGDLVADTAGILVGVVCIRARWVGLKRSAGLVALLLMPVVAVTAQTYGDLKHYYRGMAYEHEHDYVRARAEYQLALDSGFQSAELYNTIAWLDIEFLGSDPDRVVDYAAQAFEWDKDNPDILDTYGWVLVKSGRVREGLPLLEKAKALKPEMYCIDLHLGVAYQEAGDRNRATEFLRLQIERNVKDRWGRAAKSALGKLEEIQG